MNEHVCKEKAPPNTTTEKGYVLRLNLLRLACLNNNVLCDCEGAWPVQQDVRAVPVACQDTQTLC